VFRPSANEEAILLALLGAFLPFPKRRTTSPTVKIELDPKSAFRGQSELLLPFNDLCLS